MIDNSDNKNIQEGIVENDSESTIFSAPLEHNNANSNVKKRKIISTIAAVVAVAVLAASSIAVIKLVPDKNETETTPVFEEIKVLDIKTKDLLTVQVNNPNGDFKFVAETTIVTNQDGTVSQATGWLVEGVDSTKLSTDKVDAVVEAAASVTAHRKVTEKTEQECGFDNPKYTVKVTSSIAGDYSILVGDASPDATGVYLKVSTDDAIYLVTTATAEAYNFNVLDLALVNSFGAANFGSDATDYLDDSGALASFDKITVSGKKMSDTLEIIPNKDENLASLAGYIVTSPVNRYASEATSYLFQLFSSMTSVEAVYALDVSDASLSAVGLDNPDFVVSMTIRGKTVTYKIANVDDQYCAVINQDSTVISKVSKQNIAFADYSIEDFYSTWITKNMLVEITKMTFSDSEGEYVFDIEYDEEAESDSLKIQHNGKAVDAASFQKFYELFVGISCSDFTVGEVGDNADFTIKMDFISGKSETVSFYKSGEVKYQYSIDDVPLGKITSTEYNRLVKNLNQIIDSVK